MCSLKATLLRQLRLVVLSDEFGDTQSLKCGRCWTLFNEILHILYIHTTIAVFPNRFETRLLPSKRLNVFLGGDDISSLESELTVSQLAIARKRFFQHFKSGSSIVDPFKSFQGLCVLCDAIHSEKNSIRRHAIVLLQTKGN